MHGILKSIIKKEFIHIIKDPQTLLVIFIMPILMMILYGYAITLEMRKIPTIITDRSNTLQSRTLIKKISSSGFFKTREIIVTEQNIDKIFQKREARCIIVIPDDYSRQLQYAQEVKLQVLIDASDPNAANFINNYLSIITTQLNKELNGYLPVPFVLVPRFLYNPDLRSANFFVPGLVAIILMLVSALLTSIAIAREKENGTMEQILVSPITPIQIIIGKVIPYILIAFLSGLIILGMGVFLFKVQFSGSVPALLAAMIIYIFTGLSFGLLISTIAQSQRIAMIMTLLTTLLPTVMLSGFIFPVESMPLIFRIISQIIPAKHFVTIIRGLMLKGITIFDLWQQILFLILLSSLLLLVSTKKFKNTLE